MQPRCESAVIPFAEEGCFEGEGVARQEGEKTATEACAVEVEEIFICPVGLEVGGADEGELGFLVVAVKTAAAGDEIDDRDVRV